jgi:hypothetical protein
VVEKVQQKKKNHGRKSVVEKSWQKKGRKSATRKMWQKKCDRRIADSRTVAVES